MGTVYESAFLTLCPFWADSEHGLHGVSLAFEAPTTYLIGDKYVC